MPIAPQPRRVAIIGAGFSGTMAAIHLRRVLPADHVITLFERTGRFARGPAYAATPTPYLLNVRARNMSALPDDPEHFDRWIAGQAANAPQEIRATAAGVFATRRLYGRYLRALLYQEMTQSGGRVQLCADEAVSVTPEGDGWRLHCATGREVAAASVVLAVGNLTARDAADGVVFHDPWTAEATAGLRPDEGVLIIGTGLTMVDLALGLRARGFGGPLIALSRRGLVPQRHLPPGPAWPCAPFTAAERGSARRLLRAVRGRVAEAAARGVDWRSVIDAMRPATAALWQGLPPPERARFLQHVRPYWDVHRHRMAPPVADGLAALLNAGGLRLHRGRVRAVAIADGPLGRMAEVTIQDHGAAGTQVLAVQRMIHATGTGSGLAGDGLIGGLIGAGLARMDACGLGLEVTDTLHVVTRDGAAVPGLRALGPIVRGVFWECTAVPDIRLQAQALAERWD
jgi:uncharacterized NAD(P)/FAD-binding protein YdhS